MAQADRDRITSRPIRLSQLFSDPILRTVFRRAEQDGLDSSIAFALPTDRPRCLDRGAAAELVLELA